jgi:hypothetical protein
MTHNPQLRVALTRAIQRLLAVRQHSRTKISDALVDEWVAALNGVPLDAIDEAVTRCNAHEDYFPPPSTFRRYVLEVAREQARARGAGVPDEQRKTPACLTCGRETEELVLAVPVHSQTGMPRLFCRCEVSRGHALYPDEWERLQRARSAPTSHAA